MADETPLPVGFVFAGWKFWCADCHWTTLEIHPHRPEILRCSNCKEFRGKQVVPDEAWHLAEIPGPDWSWLVHPGEREGCWECPVHA
jgi:hypothetical protein